MTRVLVLGAGGMLGHKLVQRLAPRFTVTGTLRAEAMPAGYERVLDPERTSFGVRADRLETVEQAIERTAPDVVVNAIGIIKQRPDVDRVGPTLTINGHFPHELSALCGPRGIRTVQISTDCVFSGERGGYVESDVPDPVDLYGRSKLEGELHDPGTLTVRTSIVGRELRDSHGLFEWFLGNAGGRVSGYSQAIITADIEVPENGAEGIILTSGGRFGGYGFYLLQGKPVFLWNLVDLKRIKWEGAEPLSPGKHTVEFDFAYDGMGAGTLRYNSFAGMGQSGTGTLKVDGKIVDSKKMEKTLPAILQWDEAFDVGSDTLTGVNDADYKPPFALTAKLDKLTLKVDRPELSPADIQKLEAAMKKAADAQ